MTKVRSLLLAFLAVFAFAAVGAEEAAVEDRLAPVDCLPSGACAVVNVPSILDLITGAATTGLGRATQEPTVRAMLDWVRTKIEMAAREARRDPWDAVARLLGMSAGGFSVGAYSLEHGKQSGFVAVLAVKGKPDDVSAGFRHVLADLGVPTAKLTNLFGVEINGGDVWSWFVYRGNLVAVWGGIDAALVLKPGARFTQSEPWKNVTKPKEGCLSHCFIDAQRFMEMHDVNVKNPPPPPEFGFDSIGWATFELRVEDGFFRERGLIHFNAPPSGFFAAISAPAPFELASEVPADAGGFFHGRIDWANLFKSIIAAGELKGPWRLGVLPEAILAAGADKKESLIAKVKAAASDEFTMFAQFSANGFIPTYAGSIKLKDAVAAESVLDEIHTSAPDLFRISRWRENNIYWTSFEDYGPFGLGFFVKDGFLRIGNGPMGAKNLLARKAGGPNVSEQSVYRLLSSKIPASNSSSVFINMKICGEKVLPLLSFMQDLGFEDGPTLPTWPEVEPYLTGYCAGERFEGNDLIADAVGDLPAMNAICIGAFNYVVYLNAAGMFLPEPPPDVPLPLPRDQEELDRAQVQHCLEGIFGLLDGYAKNNNGAFPPNMQTVATEAVVGLFKSPSLDTTVDPKDVDGTSDFFYFPGQRRDGNILPLVCERKKYLLTETWMVMFTNGFWLEVNEDTLKSYLVDYNRSFNGTVKLENGALAR
ncbi:MAG: hypothetical protein WC712_01775 [Candidatus Brocadiia bacterium]